MVDPVAKSFILAGVPTVISVLWTLAVAHLPAEGSSSLDTVLFVMAGILSFLYLGYIATLGVFEHRRKEREDDLAKRYNDAARCQNSLSTVTDDITDLHQRLSQDVNVEIHRIQEGEPLLMTLQAFERFCGDACARVRAMLLNHAEGDLAVDVGYVRLCEEEGEDVICLCAHSGDESPRILTERRNISKSKKQCYDQRLFAAGKDTVVVLLKQKKVEKAFKWRSGSDKEQYLQFVAVPVFCRRGREAAPKMVGLLELSVRAGSLGEDAESVRKMVRKYVKPYCFTLLLAYKVFKGMQLAQERADAARAALAPELERAYE